MTGATILQWNARGLRQRHCEIRKLISDENPVVVALQETKLGPMQGYELRGYRIFRKDTNPEAGGRAHGGVAILLKEGVPGSAICLQTSLQAVAVRIEAPFTATVCSLYLPDRRWSGNELQALICQLPPPLILMGDFNAHNPWWGSNNLSPQGRIVEEVVDRSDLIMLNTGVPTHIALGTGTLSSIDLTFVTPALSLFLEWNTCRELYQSDHYPIKITAGPPPARNPPRESWDLQRADWESYRTGCNFPGLTGDVDLDVRNFNATLLRAASAAVPRKKVGQAHRKGRPVPWWNESCRRANKAKKRALNAFKRRPSDISLLELKKRRAIERRVMRTAKKQSWMAYVSSLTASTPAKEIWNKVKAVAGKYSPSPSPILKVGGRVYTDEVEVANLLAEHYSAASSTDAYSARFREVKREAEGWGFLTDLALDTGVDARFTRAELDRALSRSNDSAPGIDNIVYALLRNLPERGLRALLKLYNEIWSSGVYPRLWREAVVIPIPKEGKDHNSPQGHRPISLTCCTAKVMESMVNYRLSWYLEVNSLLAPCQAGYRRHHSTSDQLAFLEKYIQDAFLGRQHVVGVFFDLEKAFDTAWRFNIVNRLYTWGIRGRMFAFVQGFLTDRSFKVRVGSSYSESQAQENGTPQGSVLSATLFVVSANGLATDLTGGVRATQYVDDLGLFLAGTDADSMQEVMQTAIDLVAGRAADIGFSFSPTKSKCMHFCRLRKEHDAPSLYINGTRLEYQETSRFLGLIFDSKLRWKNHISDLAQRCKKDLNILRVLSNQNWGADRTTLIRILCLLVRSKMDYGSGVYGSARKSWLLPLDRVFHQGLRLALGAHSTSGTPSLHVEAGVLPMRYRREQVTLSQFEAVRARTTHFLHHEFFREDSLSPEYTWLTTRTRPLMVRARELANSLRLPEWDIFPHNQVRFPPWEAPSINIQLRLASLPRDSTSPDQYKQEFLGILARYRDRRVLYTDGSKTPTGVGCAMYSETGTKTWSLSRNAGVYTAELIAIERTLQLCAEENAGSIVICSDSLSALRAIQDKFADDPLIESIYSHVRKLHQDGRHVTLLWVPGHVGIAGNEAADRAAKRASEADWVDIAALQLSDAKTAVKNAVWQSWQDAWERTPTQLNRLKRCVRTLQQSRHSRREEVVLTRLRIGHTRLSHGYLLNGERAPRCRHCGCAALTVSHIFEECNSLADLRRACQVPSNLALALAEESPYIGAVLSFLRMAGLYSSI